MGIAHEQDARPMEAEAMAAPLKDYAKQELFKQNGAQTNSDKQLRQESAHLNRLSHIHRAKQKQCCNYLCAHNGYH
jgi:hypothetical protein